MQSDTYLNLSNKSYLKKLPNLSQIDPNINILRLTALYLHDISSLSGLDQLKKLNISYTYVKKLPQLQSLEELSMVEVELDNYNDLAKCSNLKRLKITHDNVNLSTTLNKLEVLHCSVIYRPDLIHERFPNLKEIRFEHVHPQRITKLGYVQLKYYHKLIYKKCKSTKTIIQLREPKQIDDFDDEVDIGFTDFAYADEFGEGMIEFIHVSKDISHLYDDILNWNREGDRMNIYSYGKELLESYEKNDRIYNTGLMKTLSDEEYVNIRKHYRDCYVCYGPEDDQYNKKNTKCTIIKKIIYNHLELNDEINDLINNFNSESNEIWSVDRLIMDIKANGINAELRKRVELFNRFDGRFHEKPPNVLENGTKECIVDGYSSKDVIINDNMTDYYSVSNYNNQLLTVNDVKDILYYSGKKYLLSAKQKQQFVDMILSLNKEIENELGQSVLARFENGKMIHFKLDENGKEVLIENFGNFGDYNKYSQESESDSTDSESSSSTDEPEPEEPEKLELNRSNYATFMDKVMKVIIGGDQETEDEDIEFKNKQEIFNENSDTSEEDESDSTHVQLASCPDGRIPYIPRTDRFNNIFLEDSLKIADEVEVDNQNISHLLFNDKFLSLTINVKTVLRNHLNFYGRPANFSKELIENSNGYIMMGTLGDEGSCLHVDALLDKAKDHMKLYLQDVFFVFKNRVYSNFLGEEYKSIIDLTDYLDVLDDSTVGYGGTFYPLDVIIDPHPKLILERDMTITSPTIYRNGVWHQTSKCCDKKKN